MLEDRPVLRERILATATFGGIALATAMALDVLVTGGIEFLPKPQPIHFIDPFAYAGISDARADAPSAITTAVTWNEQLPIDEAAMGTISIDEEALPPEELTGDANAQVGGGFVAPSEAELHREIAALYAEQDARAEARAGDTPVYEDHRGLDYEDAAPLDEAAPEAPAAEKPGVSAFDSASPW
jgi:hypothetical protein